MQAQFREKAKAILDVDPTRKKSWRYKIMKWVEDKEVVFPEDAPMLKRELTQAMKYNLTDYSTFETRESLQKFIANVKKNRGIVDEIFGYTFDIDYDDKDYRIYTIREENQEEYTEKLGECTSWCIATSEMFGRYELPYYLLITKQDKKRYAIVPSAGQFRDSQQNVNNSESKFEVFDDDLDLRNKYYYQVSPDGTPDADLIDHYIYEHEKFEALPEKHQEQFNSILQLELRDLVNRERFYYADGFYDLSPRDKKTVEDEGMEYIVDNLWGDFADTYLKGTDTIAITAQRGDRGLERMYYSDSMDYDVWEQILFDKSVDWDEFYDARWGPKEPTISGILKDIEISKDKEIEEMFKSHLDKHAPDWKQKYRGSIEKAIEVENFGYLHDVIRRAYHDVYEDALIDAVEEQIDKFTSEGIEFEVEFDGEMMFQFIRDWDHSDGLGVLGFNDLDREVDVSFKEVRKDLKKYLPLATI
jgi:hypothetical protein